MYKEDNCFEHFNNIEACSFPSQV